MTAHYRASVRQFVDDTMHQRIVATLSRAMDAGGDVPSDAERVSWEASLHALAKVLMTDAELLAGDIFVELMMPLTSRRCDVVLTGRNALGEATAAIVELKQWTTAQPGPYPEHVRLGDEVRLHPSTQVSGYVTHLRHFHSAFDRSRDDAIHQPWPTWPALALRVTLSPHSWTNAWRDLDPHGL
jgi:hypothetical protein